MVFLKRKEKVILIVSRPAKSPSHFQSFINPPKSSFKENSFSKFAKRWSKET